MGAFFQKTEGIHVKGTIEGVCLKCIINPRRACAARVTVLGLCVCVSVCVSVCLSVSTYSRPTGTKLAHERYQRL